jgi:hypothetical protein
MLEFSNTIKIITVVTPFGLQLQMTTKINTFRYFNLQKHK